MKNKTRDWHLTPHTALRATAGGWRGDDWHYEVLLYSSKDWEDVEGPEWGPSGPQSETWTRQPEIFLHAYPKSNPQSKYAGILSTPQPDINPTFNLGTGSKFYKSRHASMVT